MTTSSGERVQALQYPVGPDQLIVLYVVEDAGGPVDPAALYGFVAQDANAPAADGWRIASTDTVPMRQVGTAGNVLFQSGQYTTQMAIAVVYSRR
jgi:hypothetical protein